MNEEETDALVALLMADEGWVTYSLSSSAPPLTAFMYAVDEASSSFLVDLFMNATVADIRAAQASAEARTPAADATYKVYDGIAHMDFVGLMSKRPSCMSEMYGGGAYTTMLRRQASIADRDPAVKSKLLRLETPGGDIAGTFDAAGDIMHSGKPTDIYAEDMCCSAGMALAAGGREVRVNSSGAMGSVGVYTTVPDNSRADERLGRVVHVVKAGAYKAIGAGGPVTQAQLAVVQERVDAQHGIFLRHLIRGRGGMTKEQLAEVADAKVYIGQQAVAMGLADKVSTFEAAHAAAVRANKEGKQFSMAVKDDKLKAWLADPTVTLVAAEPAPAPAPAADDQTAPPPATVAAVPPAQTALLASLAAIGVESHADLVGLAAEAVTGRSVLAQARERASSLANAALADNPAALTTASAFLATAPYDVVQLQATMFEDSLRARGLAAPEGVAVAPRYSAPPALPTDGTTPTDASAQPAALSIKDLADQVVGANTRKNEASFNNRTGRAA